MPAVQLAGQVEDQRTKQELGRLERSSAQAALTNVTPAESLIRAGQAVCLYLLRMPAVQALMSADVEMG
jgi:hypothetical protein